MANGTSKPAYLSSFMSFIENQDEKPVSSSNKSASTDAKKVDSTMNKSAEVGDSEITSTGADLNPPEGEIPPKDHTELDPPADEVPPTDHTPSDEVDGIKVNESSAKQPMNIISNNGSISKRSVAKRGRRRSSATSDKTSPDNTGSETEGVAPRETPRRAAARYIAHYDVEESDGFGDSDPDYNLSDSDDDPDFNPQNKKAAASGDEEPFLKPKRGRGRGRGFSGRVRGRGAGLSRGVKRPLEDSKEELSEKPTSTVSNEPSTGTGSGTVIGNISPSKRRGRPPTYNTQNSTGSGDEKAVTSTEDKVTKLSSYNFSNIRAPRPNAAVRLPEGPQLTPEQLELVESQFKSGDFVMAKKDMDMMENPPIWRIDGKSLLQKFQAFERDGKTLYRNINTYSGWTSQAKALYVGVKVVFVFQSRYDTVVDMIGMKSQGGGDEEEPEKTNNSTKPSDIAWVPKNQPQDFEISEELRSHMPDFEIYLQTLISQALDNNFLKEIYEENDDYFVERVKVIDELAEQRKKKILEIVQWNDKFRNSLETWPCINVMVTKNGDTCLACSKLPATKLSQLYGQPYNQETLRSREPLPAEVDTKNYEVCDRCSNLSQLFNKVAHQKYDYYSQCKSTVTNMRVTHPSKHTTTILRDLLANDHWIMGLFRSMCTTWIKVDRLYQEESESLQNDKMNDSEKDSNPTESSELAT